MTSSEKSRIRSLLVDSRGNLWVGTKNGLNVVKAGSNQLVSAFSDEHRPDSLNAQSVRVLLQGRDGKIWIGTRANGIAWISPDQTTLSRTGHSKTKSAANPWYYAATESSNGDLWFGTIGDGVHIIDSSSAVLKRTVKRDESRSGGLSLNDIGSLFLDDSGLIWVGTWGSGINLFNSTNTAFKLFKTSLKQTNHLSSPHVLSILESNNGNIWIGTQASDVDILDIKQGVIENYQMSSSPLKDNSIKALAQTNDESIWIGTRRAGLYRYNTMTKEFQLYDQGKGLGHHYIRSLLSASDGSLWIGTDSGLNRWLPETDSVV